MLTTPTAQYYTSQAMRRKSTTKIEIIFSLCSGREMKILPEVSNHKEIELQK